MTKKNMIRVVAIMLLANAFLPVVIKNLPFPFYSTFFWMAAWITTLLLLNTKTYFDYKLMFILLNLFLFYLISNSNHINAYLASEKYIREIIDIFLATSAFLYFYKNDIKGLSILLKFCLAFIFITLITSTIGFIIYPDSIRYNALIQGPELVEYYLRIGIHEYDFFYGISFASPVIFYEIKEHFKTNKIFSILAAIVLIIAFVKANYAMAFIFLIAGLFLAIIGRENFKKNRVIISLVLLLIVIIPEMFYVNLLNIINSFLDPSSTLANRLSDLSLTLETGGGTVTHAIRRIERVPFLLSEISNNFFIGGGESTGHVYWLDIFSLYGIFIFISFVLMFIIFFTYFYKLMPDNYKYYFLLSIAFFVANGFIKNSGGDTLFFILFLIVPGIGVIKKYKEIREEN